MFLVSTPARVSKSAISSGSSGRSTNSPSQLTKNFMRTGGESADRFAHAKLMRVLHIGYADVLVNMKPFDLMKLRAVGRIDFITAIGRAGRDDANRRRRGLHRADLQRRSVGPE